MQPIEPKITEQTLDVEYRECSTAYSQPRDSKTESATDDGAIGPYMNTCDTPAHTYINEPVHDTPNPILGFDAYGRMVTSKPAPHTSNRDPQLRPGEKKSPKLIHVTKINNQTTTCGNTCDPAPPANNTANTNAQPDTTSSPPANPGLESEVQSRQMDKPTVITYQTTPPNIPKIKSRQCSSIDLKRYWDTLIRIDTYATDIKRLLGQIMSGQDPTTEMIAAPDTNPTPQSNEQDPPFN